MEAPTDVEYDLDQSRCTPPIPRLRPRRISTRLPPPEPKDGIVRVEVGGAYVEFHEGDPGGTDRPLLNHLAVLVDSADEHKRDAEDPGIEVERRRRGEHLAVFSGTPTASASSTSSTSPGSR